MESEDAGLTVIKRPLRLADPNFSIGVYPTNWLPELDSYEMLGVDFAHSPTLEVYSLQVQAFVKDSQEDRGLASHSVLSEHVRTILGSDPALRASLGGLQTELNGTKKSLKRFWVRSGRYVSNTLNGANLYLTTNDLQIEVEKLSG
jgi:hypothetical protein